MGEASRYSTGFKGEAIETKESFVILTKYIKREKITKAEKKQFKRQIIGLLKGTGVVVPIMLIPLPFVSTLLLIIMDHVLLSMNIQILPSSFYPEKKQGLLTCAASSARIMSINEVSVLALLKSAEAASSLPTCACGSSISSSRERVPLTH